MKTKKLYITTGLIVFFFILTLTACPAGENDILHEPVNRIEILNNRSPIPADGRNPGFSIIEERAVVLTAELFPIGVPAGVHWQSSRRIVDLSNFSGPETVLFARYGGDTLITARASNIYNEVPVFKQINVRVIPTSYFKWDYRIDGWRDIHALTSGEVDRIYYKVWAYAGISPVLEDEELGGFILEGPATLVFGSTMSTLTNSPYEEDPLFDSNAMFNFAVSPNGNMFGGPRYPATMPGNVNHPHPQAGLLINDSMYTGKVKISVEYEILTEPTFRQGLRIQVSNNTIERDEASVLSNWLVAEYNSNMPSSGILSGIFDLNEAQRASHINEMLIPGLPEIHLEITNEAGTQILYPGDSTEIIAEKRQRMIRSRVFVCLSLPDGKVLIRSVRIDAVE